MRALGLDVSKEEMRLMLQQLGKDTSASSLPSLTVSQDEFLSLMSGRLPARDSREEVEKVFRLFDEDGSGFITFRSLKRVVGELGEAMTEAEMQEMIDEADRDQDGKISFDEFFRIMKKRSQQQCTAASISTPSAPCLTRCLFPLPLHRGENPLDDWDSGQPQSGAGRSRLRLQTERSAHDLADSRLSALSL